MNPPDVEDLLRNSSSIVLIDWPNVRLPHTLLKHGFVVYGRSPKGYSKAELRSEAPAGADSITVDEGAGEKCFILFQRLENAPAQVDIVHIYRPAEELKAIIDSVAATLNPKAIWLQPPVSSDEARRLATERGIGFVEGQEILEVVSNVQDGKVVPGVD